MTTELLIAIKTPPAPASLNEIRRVTALGKDLLKAIFFRPRYSSLSFSGLSDTLFPLVVVTGTRELVLELSEEVKHLESDVLDEVYISEKPLRIC